MVSRVCYVGMSIIGLIALVCSVLGTAIAVVYLVRRPPFAFSTQLWLFLGLGVLPILTALSGNVAGMHATTEVSFCGSCHVMLAHTGDASDPHSQSLAARHSRNPSFGEQSCYTCHADYGMFGPVFTKLNGMVHVREYLLKYRKQTLEETLPELALYKPLPNKNCMQCHTTTTRIWLSVSDHSAALPQLRRGEVSCASAGCHGYAHPFTKAAREQAKKKALGGAPDPHVVDDKEVP